MIRVIFLIILVRYSLSLMVQESGMTLITAEDLDDAAEKAVKAIAS